MNILQRIKNAYETKGVLELVRKTWFYGVYKIHNHITYLDVKYRKSTYGLNEEERDRQVIVSLTSYPKRFEHLGLTLKSLTQQKYKPDRIIVYLGSDSKEEDITEEMRSYIAKGIEYRFDPTKNIRSHKKYFYALQEFPDAVVVTADDDVLYPYNWLETLVNSYIKYPNAVSARRVHRIRVSKDGKLLPYNHWFDQYRKMREPSHELIATGNSGVLYPPYIFDERVFDVDRFKEYCFEADDIWLKCMEVLCNVPVVWVPSYEVSLYEIDNEISLSTENVSLAKNDIQLERVMQFYGIKETSFLE